LALRGPRHLRAWPDLARLSPVFPPATEFWTSSTSRTTLSSTATIRPKWNWFRTIVTIADMGTEADIGTGATVVVVAAAAGGMSAVASGTVAVGTAAAGASACGSGFRLNA